MIAILATLLAVINAPYAPVSYACDGATTAYTVNFPFQASSDLIATSTTGGGAVTTLVAGTDYVMSVTSTQSTAVLTLTAGSKCPAGSTLKIVRQMALTQPTGFRGQTQFKPDLHETAYDREEMQLQQIQAQFAGTQNVNFAAPNTFTATQTFAPGSGSDAVVATATGTGRAVVSTCTTGNCINAVSTGAGTPINATSGTSGSAVVATTGNVANAPITVTPQASDPSTPANGEVWVNSTTKMASVRVGGASLAYAGNPLLISGRNASVTLTTGVFTTIVMDTITKDTESAYNGSTGVYTVPAGKGGTYSASCSLKWVGGYTGLADAFVQVNGVEVLGAEQSNPVTNGLTTTATGLLFLSAADQVRCVGFQNSGVNQSLQSGFPNRSFFHLKRLSD